MDADFLEQPAAREEAALAAGTEVTITLAPSRLGTPVGLINKIVNAQGDSILGLTALGGGPGAGGAEGRGGKQ